MNDGFPASVLISSPRFLCKQVFSKYVIYYRTGSLPNSSKPSGWSEMRTDILTTAYDLSSAWYFIFESCHPPSYFLHVSYLWLLSFPRKYNSPSYFRALEYAVPFSWAPSLSISSFTLIALKMIYCLGVRVMIRQILWTRRKITLIVSRYNSPLLCYNLV